MYRCASSGADIYTFRAQNSFVTFYHECCWKSRLLRKPYMARCITHSHRGPRHYISLSSRYFCDVFIVLTVGCISVAGGLTYRSYKWCLWYIHRMISLQDVPWPCILDVHTLINKKCFNSWNFADLCGICTMYLKLTHNGKDQIYEARSTYERIKKYL